MRGLRHTVEVLRNAGHIVVNWRGPIGVEACNTAVGSFLSASGQDSTSIPRSFPDIRLNSVSVMKDIQASCEPMLPDVAEGLRFNTESQYESWQGQRKRQIHAQWFHDVWQATSSYSGTERPIDGLIMYVASPHWLLSMRSWTMSQHGADGQADGGVCRPKAFCWDARSIETRSTLLLARSRRTGLDERCLPHRSGPRSSHRQGRYGLQGPDRD